MSSAGRALRRPRTPATASGIIKPLLGVVIAAGILYVAVEAAGGRNLLDEGLRAVGGADIGTALTSIGLTMSTVSGDLEIREYCRSEHSNELAWHFRNQTVDVPFYTACPGSGWLERFHELAPSAPLMVVDIGCNKGYSSAHVFSLWAPELGFAPNTLRTKRPEVPCGTCADCNEQVKSTVKKHSAPLTLFCVEPSMRNFAHLILTRDAFFPPTSPPDLQWYIVNAAVSNVTGVSHFPRGCVDELCSLQGNSDGTRPRDFDYVPLTTLDALVKDYAIPAIDILKIDTEGFDATVILGSMEVLARGRVSLLTFEYHEVGVWREYALRDVVEKLDGLDYVCYFDSKQTLSRMTSCWDPAYEYYNWSNVVCVKRTHFMYAELEAMSSRFERHRAEYFAGKRAAGQGKEPTVQDAASP
ncbi:hypothetical protein ACKKBG_A29120 [Auxenochlorella protothecoides x Auxenochlorella symbiontica]